MSQTRRVLYYTFFEENSVEEGTVSFYFIDLENEGIVILKQSENASLLNTLGIGKYYRNIEDAKSDFILLWQDTQKSISPLNESYDRVKGEYDSLLAKGYYKEIALSMISKKYLGTSLIKR